MFYLKKKDYFDINSILPSIIMSSIKEDFKDFKYKICEMDMEKKFIIFPINIRDYVSINNYCEEPKKRKFIILPINNINNNCFSDDYFIKLFSEIYREKRKKSLFLF